MFDSCNKSKLKVLAISLSILAVLFIVLVIVLPILIHKNYLNNSTEKTTPHSDNTDLWAKFPGELKTSLKHKFSILEYSDTQDFKGKVKVKDSFTLEEEINYENFNFTDKEDTLLFDAKSTFKYPKNEEIKTKEINTLSMGLFETLETLTNPPLYQKGIDSIQYLLNKALAGPEVFIKQLFTYEAYSNLIVDDERVKSTLLKGVDSSKADLILSTEEKYKKYSFKSVSGLFQWVKILGDQKLILKATWLTELFGLTTDEINSVLGKGKYLYIYLKTFNQRLAYKFNCENENACGNEILYLQLMSGNVTSYVGAESMVDLYSVVDPEYYPFSKSPELAVYFEEYKQKHDIDSNYTDYAPSVDQLNKMIDPTSESCLLAANNSALFLELNKTDNNYKAYEIYKISAKIMYFMADYFYDYLPSLFLYQEFEDEETHKKLTIDPIAKTYATIAQGTIDRTYGKLIKSDGIYNLVLSKLVWSQLKDLFDIEKKNSGDISDEVCPSIMQQVLDDGKKVLTICGDPVIGFNSPLSLSKWFDPYPCIKSGDESKCDMTVVNYLKSLVYITDDEIKSIYGEDLIGGAIDENEKIVKEACECDEDCDNEYLSKIQFWQAKITKNLPEPYKSNTINSLLPDDFPYPIELSYFQEEKGQTEPVDESLVDYLIILASKGDTLLSEESSDALITKTNLEKDLTKMLNGQKFPDENILKVIDLLNNGYLFNDILYTKYANRTNLIQGATVEDKRFIDFLSSGNTFENYKPGLKKSTGLNLGINLDTGKPLSIEFDRYGIYGKQTDTSHNMRRIISMNGFSVLNIKKEEYNYLEKSFSLIDSPVYDFKKLLDKHPLSDGFEYEHDLDSIYFYDRISSRPFKFDYSEDVDYKDQLKCRKYILDNSDLSIGVNEAYDKNSKKAILNQKMNKPYMISVGNKDLSVKIDGENLEDNYICVDVFTNLVVESKMNLVYSLYTRKYGFINKKIENDKVCPIFTYQRNYEVDIDSYIENFPGNVGYYTFKIVFIIISVIIILVCLVFIIIAIRQMNKGISAKEVKENIPEEKLLESSVSAENK